MLRGLLELWRHDKSAQTHKKYTSENWWKRLLSSRIESPAPTSLITTRRPKPRRLSPQDTFGALCRQICGVGSTSLLGHFREHGFPTLCIRSVFIVRDGVIVHFCTLRLLELFELGSSCSAEDRPMMAFCLLRVLFCRFDCSFLICSFLVFASNS